MAWDDLPRLERDLADALDTFDWAGAEAVGRRLIARLRAEGAPFPPDRAQSLLKKLRRKRQFPLMALVAEALLESGLRSARTGIQYAQALIERGYLTPAELILRAAGDPAAAPSPQDAAEILGLLGRTGKQRYVVARNPGDARYRALLADAVRDYRQGYEMDPASHWWHGVNVAALVARARRDGVPLDGAPDPGELARHVLAALTASAGSAPLPAWGLAARLEAQIALGDHPAAEAAGLDYAGDADADAFELASTLRQLTDVWGLDDHAPPGSTVLPILRAALLRREGGRLQLTAATAHAELRDEVGVLEKNFGRERFRPLGWYRAGLERCRAIARIETKTGSGHGTGWLVSASALFPGRPADEALLITNAHVLSTTGFPGALAPAQARVNFSMTGALCDVGEVMWTSPPSALDATIARVAGAPAGVSLPVSPVALAMPPPGEREPRLYIIGHPSGRDLEFSLQDNAMLGCNERVVHYRTPTEGGSSGSPVFDEENWDVVALHHGGKATMSRLDGKEGTYEANEGIALRAIQQALAGGARPAA